MMRSLVFSKSDIFLLWVFEMMPYCYSFYYTWKLQTVFLKSNNSNMYSMYGICFQIIWVLYIVFFHCIQIWSVVIFMMQFCIEQKNNLICFHIVFEVWYLFWRILFSVGQIQFKWKLIPNFLYIRYFLHINFVDMISLKTLNTSPSIIKTNFLINVSPSFAWIIPHTGGHHGFCISFVFIHCSWFPLTCYTAISSVEKGDKSPFLPKARQFSSDFFTTYNTSLMTSSPWAGFSLLVILWVEVS